MYFLSIFLEKIKSISLLEPYAYALKNTIQYHRLILYINDLSFDGTPVFKPYVK